MAAQIILRTGFYSKAEASAWALPLGIAQGVIDSWFSNALAEGPGRHAYHTNKGNNEMYLGGAELIYRAMKALGAGWTVGV